MRKFPELIGEHTAEIVIIGGGMTGILNAFFLSKEGKRVILLEADELGHSATLKTTAFLTQIIDTNALEIKKISGDKHLELLLESHGKAIEELEKLVRKLEIKCELIRCPAYSFARTQGEFEFLREEERLYRKLGLKAEAKEDRKLNFRNNGYLEISGQGKFNPGKFLAKIAEKAAGQGAQIFENSPAISIEGSGPIIIKTEDGKIKAEKVIIATYKPFINEKTEFKKGMYRSYVFEIIIPPNTLEEAIYWDQDNPYRYFRIDRKEGWDRMILGGEDHRDIPGINLEDKSFESLEKYFRELLPDTKYIIDKKWSGPILEPSDGLALIGEIKPDYYVATAYSGNGMTYAMISAMILKDILAGIKNPYTELYDPKRNLISKEAAYKAKDYIEEFIRGALKNILE